MSTDVTSLKEFDGIVTNNIYDITSVKAGSIFLSSYVDGVTKFGPLIEVQIVHSNYEPYKALYTTGDISFLTRSFVSGLADQLKSVDASRISLFGDKQIFEIVKENLTAAKIEIGEALDLIEKNISDLPSES